MNVRNRETFFTQPFIAIQFAAAAVVAILSTGEWPSEAQRPVMRSLVYLVMGLPTLYAILGASRAQGVDSQTARAWRIMAFAVGCWWMGDVTWAATRLITGDFPVIGVSDVFYVAFAPLALWSLVTFPGLGTTRSARVRAALDAAFVAITAGTVMMSFAPPNADGAFGFVETISNSHVIASATLLTFLLVLLTRQSNRRLTHVFRMIILGLALKTMADVLHRQDLGIASRSIPLLIDICWMAWYATMSLAAVSQRDAPQTVTEDAPPAAARGWLPYACVLSLIGLRIALVQTGELPAVGGIAFGIMLLLFVAMVRQSMLTRENLTLESFATSRVAESRLAALVNHASDVILVVDVDGISRYVSPSVQRVLGTSPERLLAAPLFDVLHPDDADAFRLLLGRLTRRTDSQETIIARIADAEGDWRWMEVVGTNRLQTASIHGLVLNARDITERRELEGKIEWQAFHDPMTGLANRVLFADRVSHALARRERGPVDIGLLFIDLDHFKAVNDTLGHAAGDELLRQVARRIEGEVRTADTIARLGGDEFAVLLEDSDAISCDTTAERLQQQLTRPFIIEGRDVVVGASIGLTDAPAGTSLDELVRDADVAMYVAKGEGRGRVVRFEASMREKVAERLELEADLRRAVDRNELQVHYQPLVDLQTGDILGAEALLRWHHPLRGLINPSTFIPIAEDAGLISEISRRVLHTACRDATTWRSPDPTAATLHVAVNLSGRHLQEPTVVDDVRAALAASGLHASQLTIEITETVMMHNADAAIDAMRALKALGVTLALDDFGTGYSSLSYLQRFPIDVIKIDRSFINQLGGPTSDDSLTRAIISLGETLGLATIAEGIEGERQLSELQAMGCMLGQGFLMSQAVTGPVFARLVASGEPLHRRPGMLPTPSRGSPLISF